MIIRLTEATPQNAGAKAAVLGELIRGGFPVPRGFVIPVAAYRAATAHLDLPHALTSRNPSEARQLVEAQPVPPQLLDELSEALAELGNHPVAVRSSATTEDTPTASAAGQHDTYLGVHGLPAITTRIQAIWGSLWSPRAITYRQTTAASTPVHPPHVPPAAPGIAILIQRHIDAEVAGVLFTADPHTNTAVLEASWGLGESVVQGLVTPDTYTQPPTGPPTHHPGIKPTRVDRSPTPPPPADGGTVTTAVPFDQRELLCLSDQQALRIVQMGNEVAAHLGGPQDIEFAVENDRVWLLQSRPITAPLGNLQPDSLQSDEAPTSQAKSSADSGASSEPATPGTAPKTAHDLGVLRGVLRGVGGSPGVATGPARVVNGVEDFGRVEAGDILVCRFTDPAWTPLFGLVAGVVTELGGRLSHAAIVAREHRIPAVLGVPDAMITLADGRPTTIEGNTGLVRPAPPTEST